MHRRCSVQGFRYTPQGTQAGSHEEERGCEQHQPTLQGRVRGFFHGVGGNRARRERQLEAERAGMRTRSAGRVRYSTRLPPRPAALRDRASPAAVRRSTVALCA